MADKQIQLLGYVKLTGKIKTVSGLHIGGTADSIDKGGIDTPVIKNPVTNEPYIPGSSLRGRIRSILEKKTAARLKPMTDTIWMEIYKKEDDRNLEPNAENSTKLAKKSKVCRVFGNSASAEAVPSILIVRDACLSEGSKNGSSNGKRYMQNGLPVTEAKMEIVVDRITAHALPRTIERVPSGAEFNFEIVYKVQTDEDGKFVNKSQNKAELKADDNLQEDLTNLVDALEIIETMDGLGGNTSRGHGQVEFIFDEFIAKKIDGSTPNGFSASLSNDSSKKYAELKKAIKTINFSTSTVQTQSSSKATSTTV